MSYHFEPTELYRMPTHFGPATSPRRGPDGRRFACKDTPKTTAVTVSFLSRPEQLSALLPPGFSLGAEAVVTVTASYMKEIEWLAGRGYNMLGVTIPAIFQSKAGPISGSFLLVLWENLTEPIITGREELGFSKIFADLPEPVTRNDELRCAANWDGFRFLDLSVGHLQPLSAAQIAAQAGAVKSAGTLHYKYLPRTGEPGRADVRYAVLTPLAVPNRVVTAMSRGQGTLQFHRARWEDMPTQYMIVNALHALDVLEYRGATVAHTVGGKDLSDQQILLEPGGPG
jgi:hypothetical protein